ncbi:hypothetical protein BKA67DRAFT_546484 [Truncatella angustata]|uniref:ATP-dependent DNA helicase n=1 Tax=Truncatella angustata TaxID=152316 RepID=A0A9P8UXJ3_9PEZI|nr:uncharacterized protein BKA67DRAFT_546484 [Truncatella angustata]KAH6660008.1 hypothetical protein BKA67DRAFT_546484 [Truncatella angustata]
MDSDEFDDDILDEDLIIAATQFPSNIQSSKPTATSNFHPHVQRHGRVAAGNSFNSPQRNNPTSGIHNAAGFIDLDDLPDDAFSSPPHTSVTQAAAGNVRTPARFGGPAPNYRQMTLFGSAAPQNGASEPAQRMNSIRKFRADLPEEKPTHHDIDRDAMKTWVYPTNLGAIREYQYTIVKEGLFNNTLVALPTGLGKTFIAATVMLNFYRWTKTAKIIFVAPTKPLVSQQVDACFNIAGIPRSQTTLLTGEISPALREDEWKSKRVFFMTPQTLENDLSSGAADPKSIALLVVDEAHRATGNYSYTKVVTFLRRFSSSFRILALTATPGSKVEAVQEVIDGLGISHVEIRTEDSLDIRQYVHHRQEDIELLDPSEEMVFCRDLFSKALKPLVDKLSQQNIYYGRDPMSLTTFGLLKARKDWLGRAGHSANQGVKFMMFAIFTILQGLAHAIKLLNFHGIKPFYDNLVRFREEIEDKGAKGSKFKRQVVDSPDFQQMMGKVGDWLKKDDFVSHPKLTCLSETILNHFMDAGEGREDGGSSNTRIIVFSEYRDSAEEIVRILNRHEPLIRAAVFVGQADTTKSSGMKQTEQIERIKKFKEGVFNVLVATSIGEEGLDIGQVDLIVCYDASASPIRMLQRMGRTGRKRAGRVVLLLMRGKEEDNYAKSKDGYDKMQQMICEGSRFAFRHDLSTRIVPRDIKPEVDKRHVEIPIENTQNQSLPEPKKGAARKKRAPKKFHMPDGVETGFTSVASMLGKRPKNTTKSKVQAEPREEDEVADIPEAQAVWLNSRQTEELRSTYQNLPYYQDQVQEVPTADLTAQTEAQRTLRKTVLLMHGEHTKQCVKLFRKMAKIHATPTLFQGSYTQLDGSRYLEISVPSDLSDSEIDVAEVKRPPQKKRKTAQLDGDEEVEVNFRPRKAPAKPRQIQKPKAVSKSKQAVHHNTFTDEDDGGVHDGDSLELTPPRRQKPVVKNATSRSVPTKKRGRPSKNKQSGVYDESADEGDDCRRTSDLELTAESDDGSDLEDFVVGDDVATSSAVPTSSMRRVSTSPTTPSMSSVAGRQFGQGKQYYEKASLSTTQDSEDDMPSMSQIVGRNKSRATEASDLEKTDDEEIVQRIIRGPRRRAVINDDEDSDV